MVASGVAAGVVSDATVRDEDAVSGISNGYKYHLIKIKGGATLMQITDKWVH